MSENILSMKEVVKRTSLSRRTIYRLMGAGKFPKSFQVTDGRIGFSKSEVEDWIKKTADRSG
jgi:prophage regulatory protein